MSLRRSISANSCNVARDSIVRTGACVTCSASRAIRASRVSGRDGPSFSMASHQSRRASRSVSLRPSRSPSLIIPTNCWSAANTGTALMRFSRRRSATSRTLVPTGTETISVVMISPTVSGLGATAGGLALVFDASCFTESSSAPTERSMPLKDSRRLLALAELRTVSRQLVLQVLVAYRLIEPGSEWRLHREWFGKSAMADLLGAYFGLAETHKLYACHGLLLAHKDALFSHLTERWRDLFNANFDVLLYDLTSTYFEVNASDLPEGAKRRHGYSRDKRPDCPQLVIALVVTPEGLPLAYEVLPGNTADSKTLRTFLSKIEKQYGKARRVWVMDRGVPTEAVLAEMRASDPPVQYLVGTPKGRLNRLEKHLIE